MGFRHVVMFRFRDGATDEQRAALARGLDGMPAATGAVEPADYKHGPDLGINPASWGYVVVADFASADTFLTYAIIPITGRSSATWSSTCGRPASLRAVRGARLTAGRGNWRRTLRPRQSATPEARFSTQHGRLQSHAATTAVSDARTRCVPRGDWRCTLPPRQSATPDAC